MCKSNKFLLKKSLKISSDSLQLEIMQTLCSAMGQHIGGYFFPITVSVLCNVTGVWTVFPVKGEVVTPPLMSTLSL